MNADVPLLKLPDVAMNRILRHCEYLDFARLRKTCHSLRGFLDTTRPDARMDIVVIECDAQQVTFRLLSSEKRLIIQYKNVVFGCRIVCNSNWASSKFLRGMNYMEVFKNDLAIFLRYQKSLLKNLEIHGNPVYSEEVLRAMNHLLLKTTKLSLIDLSVPQILRALSSIDAKFLNILQISKNGGIVDFNEITATEHWKHLNHCVLLTFAISDICRISHFNEFHGVTNSITVADLDFLKKTFVNSSTFNRCIIRYNETISLSDTVGKFGVQPYENEWDRSTKQWCFRIPNDNTKVLKLDVNNRSFIGFTRVSAADVPYAAVVTN
ncbi:hypothetical protein CRE_23438 [Caenorhabditis remanei]|uniref:F-box domain-containing protein n=1 Tax=Caenorhabditis remanei TaxID=31234 RepID=E3MGS0_CAERE|nr:hypothetical protein CRE_23438 [Caenorhabditis remanei]